jgi:hypothetical protein
LALAIISDSRQEIDDLRDEIKALEKEIKRLNAMQHALRQSTFWAVTSPLRWILNIR